MVESVSFYEGSWLFLKPVNFSNFWVILIYKLINDMENIYHIDRQIIEEFCNKYMQIHTDWTGPRVETKNKCESVDKFVDLLMNYIEENQFRFNVL